MRNLISFSFFFIIFSLYPEEYRIPAESGKAEREKLARFFEEISSGQVFNDKETEQALKRSNVLSFRSAGTEKALRTILSGKNLNPVLVKASMDYIYSRYTDSFQEEVKRLLSEEKDIRLKLIYSLYLEKGNPEYENLTQKLLEEEFAENHPYRQGYFLWKKNSVQDVYSDPENLLSSPFIPGNWILFSLQRKDSRYPGILIIRRPDGKFLKEENGAYFHISHLASSASGLPFFIRNGNTPKGIYFFQDTAVSENPDIGPVPALRLYMPGEISPADFFGNRRMKKKWNYRMIKNILPPSLQNTGDFRENYIAGAAGRSGIWSHGTAVDPEFFRDSESYPLIPALGCFTSAERWSKKSGRLLYSSHLTLLKTMKKHKINKGYLIAAVLNSKEKPVTLEEILPALSLTEE